VETYFHAAIVIKNRQRVERKINASITLLFFAPSLLAGLPRYHWPGLLFCYYPNELFLTDTAMKSSNATVRNACLAIDSPAASGLGFQRGLDRCVEVGSYPEVGLHPEKERG
jgi:hypothetical protein